MYLCYDKIRVKTYIKHYLSTLYILFYMSDSTIPVLQIPANFNSMVYDFVTDLTTTFPEFSFLWKRWNTPDMSLTDQDELFRHFTKVFPERFFDILYQNDDIFNPDNNINTAFLPNVDFKLLIHCGNITETTKNAIWKYLQLILISVIGSVQNKSTFGDTASLFEGFDDKVIHEKLNETIDNISNFFKDLGTNDATTEEGDRTNSAEFAEKMTPDNMPDFAQMEEEMRKAFQNESSKEMPNAEDLHKHLQGLFDGKIGCLAKELAEEISVDMQNLFQEEEGAESIQSTQDLLKKMIKNPKKMMDLMKTIGDKLQKKMKSGEITEEEIMKEASELMGKMKGMGGMGKGGFADIMKNLAQGMIGKNARFNATAFNNMEKKMSAKERMRAKLAQKRQATAEKTTPAQNIQFSLNTTETPDNYVFSLPEEDEQEKTQLKDINTLAQEIESVGIQPTAETQSKKKKRGKK
jgi:hypothetical protein